MKELRTLSDLFDQAIRNEEAMVRVYRGFADIFKDTMEAAIIFNDLALDEERHAFELEMVRDRLSDDELLAPANPDLLTKLKKMENRSIKKMLNGVKNLDGACELIRSIEYGKINEVFEELTTKYPPSKEMTVFIEKEMGQHFAKLEVLFKRFPDRETRSSILADHRNIRKVEF